MGKIKQYFSLFFLHEIENNRNYRICGNYEENEVARATSYNKSYKTNKTPNYIRKIKYCDTISNNSFIHPFCVVSTCRLGVLRDSFSSIYACGHN